MHPVVRKGTEEAKVDHWNYLLQTRLVGALQQVTHVVHGVDHRSKEKDEVIVGQGKVLYHKALVGDNAEVNEWQKDIDLKICKKMNILE